MKKSHFYSLKGLKSDNENLTSNLDVPKSNPHGEDEDRNHISLVNLKSSTR